MATILVNFKASVGAALIRPMDLRGYILTFSDMFLCIDTPSV